MPAPEVRLWLVDWMRQDDRGRAVSPGDERGLPDPLRAAELGQHEGCYVGARDADRAWRQGIGVHTPEAAAFGVQQLWRLDDGPLPVAAPDELLHGSLGGEGVLQDGGADELHHQARGRGQILSRAGIDSGGAEHNQPANAASWPMIALATGCASVASPTTTRTAP